MKKSLTEYKVLKSRTPNYFLPFTSLPVLLLLLVLVIILPQSSRGDSRYSISGESFDSLMQTYDLPLMQRLSAILPPTEGFSVAGPIDRTISSSDYVRSVYGATRVLCPSIESLLDGVRRLKADSTIKVSGTDIHITKPRKNNPIGYRGAILRATFKGHKVTIQLNTLQQLRWLMWAQESLVSGKKGGTRKALLKYTSAVSDYLYQVDTGNVSMNPPQAVDYELSARIDLFHKLPQKTINDRGAFLALLDSNRSINTDFAKGILSFQPNDSLLASLKDRPEKTAYFNKEHSVFQHQAQSFLKKNGSLLDMQNLTREGFDTLHTGDYYFAVGLSGEIRFGFIIDSNSVANQSLLFPNEPILTAGLFSIKSSPFSHLVRVNSWSEKFFYSNLQPTTREDITVRSDQFLLTLGHFFKALDNLGIPYQSVVISKF